MILKINTFESAKYISNLYSKTTLIYTTNTTKKNSMIPWLFYSSITQMLALGKILPTHGSLKHFIWPRDHINFKKQHAVCVYRQMCVHIQLYIYIKMYIYTNIYAHTRCSKHRRTQTPTISPRVLLSILLSSPQFQEFSAANICLSMG